MENKYLQIRKENIFTKFVKFIKGIFGKRVIEEVKYEEEIAQKQKTKTTFIEELKIEQPVDTELIKLQKQFENNEIDLKQMSNEQINKLNKLYKKQISELKEKLQSRKIELTALNKKYSTEN